MIKNIFSLVVFILITSYSFSQQGVIKGTVKDKITGETLIGANVLFAEGKGVITDMDGNFIIEVPTGEYSITVSYIGYKSISQKITVNDNTVTVDFALEGITLSEVQVVADVARARETPVAFSTIPTIKLQEELASRDIPMILNSTPGVYATQSGGGDGDARITIRGFNQRNVAVMLDGIPVNDMENGWVYWSNWFGLDMVTRSIQVQRGLGASKLANPSVGGTLNIISQGIEAKKGGKVKQELGNDGFLRTSFGLTSGQLKNGFCITVAGSYKQGNGWVDQTWTKGWFYFLKVEKKLGKHLVSASGMGAPQKHAQRSYTKSIAYFDAVYADKLGITDSLKFSEINGYGIKFNPHWGYIRRYRGPAGDTIPANITVLNERVNYYHKPQFTLKDFWTINDKFYVSNIAYLSVGSGGGTRLNASNPSTDSKGQIDFQKIYNSNVSFIDAFIDTIEHKSTTYLYSSVNNHFWYGLLSTLNYSPNNHTSLSIGFDMRDYIGRHYRTVYDLIGGNYLVDNSNQNQETNVKKRTGDKIGYYNDGMVRWGGTFAQAEIKGGFWTAFINTSGAYSGYKRIDYFRRKELLIGDTTLNIGFNDTIPYQGTNYTRDAEGLRIAQTDWKWIPGFTIKTGANFNITEHQNVFFNAGYLSKTPRFNNVIDRNNEFFKDIKNEIVKAVETGYGIRHKKYAVNINGYYTIWENKPADRPFQYTDTLGDIYSVNINKMNALHQGVELDFIYKIFDNLEVEGLTSFGDWIWTSKDTARIYSDYTGKLVGTQNFDAKGVHVGDAAQMQYGVSIRYEIIKGLYLKTQGTYFGKNFAEFNPFTLDGADAGRESWQMPDYYLFDIHAGYNFKIGKIKMDIKASVLNLLNEVYVSDAINNDPYSSSVANKDFDAKSAGVFFGLGRRFNTSLQITF